ncbi:MAG: CHAD domain-containing protein [Chitinivibrionales bacterium]|nr:CHAD domain-containing protein [Chitinivibrionales bacterium]
MSYRYRIEESTQQNIERIAGEQIAKARSDLTPERIADFDGIHQARKRFKKIRSVFKLVRPALGKHYPELNGMFREAGHSISEWRDLESMVTACDNLREYISDATAQDALSQLQQDFAAKLEEKTKFTDRFLEHIERIDAMLYEADSRIAELNLGAQGSMPVKDGLLRVYRAGRKEFARAGEDPASAQFHQWRKREKDLWYQVRLLHDAWPRVLKGLAVALHELANTLGDDHDLALVSNQVTEASQSAGNSRGGYTALQEDISRRKSVLQRNAYLSGKRVYAERPKAFAARFENYWQAWEQQQSNAQT